VHVIAMISTYEACSISHVLITGFFSHETCFSYFASQKQVLVFVFN